MRFSGSADIKTMTTREEALHHVPLFSSLPESELRELAGGLLPTELGMGNLMFREGGRGNDCYIIVEGRVEIIKSMGTPDERLLGVREAGEAIGEMSLFSDDHQRTASVRAKTPLKLLLMKRDHLKNLLRGHPDLAFNLVATLSRRLGESEDRTIADLREKNRQLQEAFDELKAAQAQIVEKERLERELEVARDIQLSILPRELPEDPAWDLGVHFSSMEAVGGDFYDVIELGNSKLGVAVGDVSGHGVPAALFMSLTATMLRAEAKRPDSPGDVLRAVNSQLLETSDWGCLSPCSTGSWTVLQELSSMRVQGIQLRCSLSRVSRRCSWKMDSVNSWVYLTTWSLTRPRFLWSQTA